MKGLLVQRAMKKLYGVTEMFNVMTGCDYTTVYVFQNSSNYTIKIVNLLYVDYI